MVEQINYEGAGTQSLFMKMESFIFGNEYTIQVEHPVTEVQTE